MKPSAVILAAGSGARMGADKLLVPVGGAPMLARAIAPYLACEALAEVVVVVRPGFRRPEVSGAPKWVENPLHAEGMASSLRLGVAAVAPDAEGFVLGLGDLPFLRAETVAAAVEAWRAAGRGILVATAGERRGHPVLLGARFRSELLAAQGDVGAREVLRAHPESVTFWECGDPGVADDVDTAADLPRGSR